MAAELTRQGRALDRSDAPCPAVRSRVLKLDRLPATARPTADALADAATEHATMRPRCARMPRLA
jgi:hypothetical protein